MELPDSVERVLRGLLQDDGRVSKEQLDKIGQELDSADRSGANRDSNEDRIGAVGESTIVADGGLVRRVVLEGLRRRLTQPVDQQEILRITGRGH
ncbi:MAG: hypothetical protein IT372_21155 [Polyangiaceae bacterium]|nr:hypothetical protein [Polyangiaceae bacterium]